MVKKQPTFTATKMMSLVHSPILPLFDPNGVVTFDTEIDPSSQSLSQIIYSLLQKINYRKGSQFQFENMCDEYLVGFVSGDEASGDEEEHEPIVVPARGRVGKQRAKLHVNIDRVTGKVRIDCENNPEFWLEFHIPLDKLAKK